MKNLLSKPGFFAAAGLMSQIVAPLVIFGLANAGFGTHRILNEGVERPVSLLFIGFAGLLGLALGGYGAFLALSRASGPKAFVYIVFGCFPALVGGVTYLYALLIFLALV